MFLPAAVLVALSPGARSQAMFEVVKWAGVAYLAYLGIRSLLARPVSDDDPAGSPAAGRLVRARREFLTVAANPKALLLFTAFLPQFVDRTEPVAAVAGDDEALTALQLGAARYRSAPLVTDGNGAG